MSQHPGRRATDGSPSGGMVLAANAARILNLTPNGFRDVVARGLIEPVYTFSNGPQPLRVYRREDVERLAAGRRMYAETEPRLRVAMGLKRAEQAKLPGTLRRGEW